jgi:murein DD-endopeptidase MepM/ murein hydrolase activator NlpD
MGWKFSFASLCLLGLLRQTHAQEVIIPREEQPHFPRGEIVAPVQSLAETHGGKAIGAKLVRGQPPEKKSVSSSMPIKDTPKLEDTASPPPNGDGSASQATKLPSVVASPKPAVAVTNSSGAASRARTAPAPPSNSEHESAQSKSASVIVPKPKRLTLVPGPAGENHKLSAAMVPPASNQFETAFIKLANGFDFPVGKPDAQGYYKARGFRSRGHLGEDWDGLGGGDTDLGDPIYSIGDGLVVFARDCHMGWGNVMIVRHSYREAGVVKTIDALYAHLDKMLVRRGEAVARGQQIATMGTAHGLYDAHLHLEIRKNIEVGMSRTAFARDFSNYYDPSQFIVAHRHLPTNGGSYRIATNTFVRDATINFDKARNFSHSRSKGGTRESAAALKKALASKQ